MISIVLASYNGERYISAQINSILAQTIQDFELIVSDDCSTDCTCTIVETYIQQDGIKNGTSRIFLYRQEINAGFKKNFEQALQYAKGSCIALCDQDDIWLPNHLEILLSLIGDAQLCCGNAELIDDEGHAIGTTLFETYGDMQVLTDAQKVLIRLLYKPNPFQGASMLMKRSFLEQALPIPDTVPFHDTWFALTGAASNSFVFTQQIVTKYRRHDTQVTKKVKKPFSVKYNVMSVRFLYAQEASIRTGSSECSRAVEYYRHIHKRSYRFVFLPFWMKQYKTIFLTNTYLKLPIRFIKFLFF